MLPFPADIIMPPLWAVVDVKLRITDVVLTVGITIVTDEDEESFLQPLFNSTTGKKNKHREIYLKKGVFMQINR